MVRLGIYVQVEVFVVAVLLLIPLTLIFVAKDIAKSGAHITCLQGVFAAAMAYAGLQLLYVDDPYIHFHALPQSFEGLAWFGLAFLLAGFHRSRNNLVEASLVFLGIISLNTLVNHPTFSWALWPRLVPYTFLSYMGLVGALVIGFAEFFEDQKYRKFALGLGVFLVLTSSNKTAICSLLFFGGLYYLYSQKLYMNVIRWVVLSAPITILSLEITLNHFFDFGTLAERVIGLKVVAYAMRDNPWVLLFGKGFGIYPDLVQQYLYDLPMSYYSSGRILDPSWGYVLRADFHSHHQLVEMVLQMGVFGAVAYIMPFYWSLQGMNSKNAIYRLPALGTILCVQSLWFPYAIFMPVTLVYLICAVGSSSGDFRIRPTYRKSLLIVSAVVIVAAGTLRATHILFFDPNVWGHSVVRNSKVIQKVVADARRGTDLAATIEEAGLYWNPAMKANESASLEYYQTIPRPSLMLLEALHKALESLSLKRGKLNSDLENVWEGVYNHVTTRMPRRTDLQMGYIYYLMHHHEENFGVKLREFRKLSSKYGKTEHNDPLIAYVHGKSLQQQGDELGFQKYFKRAYKLGLRNWIPLNEQVIAHMESQLKGQSKKD